MSTSLDETGPIDYLVVEFPGNRMTGEGFPLLLDLVDRGIIRILDLVFVTRDTDGSVTAVEIADFDGDGELDLAVFQGASSGLLGPDDLEEAASVIEPGSSAGILVYENVWAAPFAVALRRGGAQLGGQRPDPGPSHPRRPRGRRSRPDGHPGRGRRARRPPKAPLTRRPERYHSPKRSRKAYPCQVCFVESPAPPLSPEPLPPSPDASNTANRDGGRQRSNKPPPNKPQPEPQYAGSSRRPEHRRQAGPAQTTRRTQGRRSAHRRRIRRTEGQDPLRLLTLRPGMDPVLPGQSARSDGARTKQLRRRSM